MKLLHIMLRVGHLERSISFYTTMFGMTCLRKKEYPHGKFTLAFLGFQDEANETVLELTYNWGVTTYNIGTGYGHIAFSVEDLYKTCDKIKQKGGLITRPPGPMTGSTSLLAFVEDPDGYKIELLERTEGN